jgi:hypothetical protein
VLVGHHLQYHRHWYVWRCCWHQHEVLQSEKKTIIINKFLKLPNINVVFFPGRKIEQMWSRIADQVGHYKVLIVYKIL